MQALWKNRSLGRWTLTPLALLVVCLVASTAIAQDRGQSVSITPYMVETDSARPIAAEWINLSAPENRSATVDSSPAITATTNISRGVGVDGSVTITRTTLLTRSVATEIDSNAANILVPFVRFRTTARSPQAPVFVLVGEDQTELVSPATAQRFLRLVGLLLNTSDVVLVGQRGLADGFPHLSCADEQRFPLDTPALREQVAASESRYVARCTTFWQSSGSDTAGYNIVESAADVDELRRALDYDKITLVGVDFGVQIGFEVLRTYEGSVDRALFPLVVGPNQSMKLPGDLQEHLEKLAVQVQADPALNGVIPDFLTLVENVLNSLDGQTVSVTVKDPLTGEPVTVTAGKYDLQYVTAMAQGGDEQKSLPAHYYEMTHGDFTWLGEQVLALRRAAGQQDLAPILATCASGATEDRRLRVALEATETLLGDAANGVRFDICDSADNPDIGDLQRQAVVSDVPVLFVSGSMDGHTPPSNTAVLLSGLINGQHLIVEGGTHDMLDNALPEIAQIFGDFLIGDPLAPLETTRISVPYELEPVTVAPLEIANWRGEYFNNRTVQGDPTLVRDDVAINFNWGAGSPAPSINADDFSARWTMSREVPAGTYRFSTWVDDGVRIWVDDVLILDRWHEGPARNYIVDVNVVRGLHTVRMEYFEATDQALAQLSIGRIEEYPDWKAEYFDNAEFAGTPVVLRNEPAIDHVWGASPPVPGIAPGPYAVRWNGQFPFPQGAIRFDANVSGGGVRLWVGDTLVIDDTLEATPRTVTADYVFPTAGNYNVRTEYIYGRGNAAIALSWQRTGASVQVPPTAVINAPTFALIGGQITLDGSASTAADGSALSAYSWDLGDGTAINGSIVTHAYSAAGFYNITLTVTDALGNRDAATHQIRVDSAPITPTPVAPVAVIRAPDQGIVGQAVTFDARTSQSTNPIVGFNWQFGDGTVADAIIVEKTYGAPGVYNVTLTLTDDQGLQGRDTRFVQIYAADPQPTAVVPPTSTAAPVQPTPIPVEPTQTPVGQQPPTGGVDPTPSPQPESLTVTPETNPPVDQENAAPPQSDSPVPTPIAEEYLPPVPVIVAQIGDEVLQSTTLADGNSGITAPMGQAITFDARQSQPGQEGIDSYFWDFGNGQTSPLDVLPVTYSEPAVFEVRLTLKDKRNITSTTNLLVNVIETGE